MKQYKIPDDPHILYSFVNVMLRDRYASLQEFCEDNGAKQDELVVKLADAGYIFNEEVGQFR